VFTFSVVFILVNVSHQINLLPESIFQLTLSLPIDKWFEFDTVLSVEPLLGAACLLGFALS